MLTICSRLSGWGTKRISRNGNPACKALGCLRQRHAGLVHSVSYRSNPGGARNGTLERPRDRLCQMPCNEPRPWDRNATTRVPPGGPMAFRELSVTDVREALRRWQVGERLDGPRRCRGPQDRRALHRGGEARRGARGACSVDGAEVDAGGGEAGRVLQVTPSFVLSACAAPSGGGAINYTLLLLLGRRT